MKPDGLFGPGARKRAISPATKPMMTIQTIPMAPLAMNCSTDDLRTTEGGNATAAARFRATDWDRRAV